MNDERVVRIVRVMRVIRLFTYSQLRKIVTVRVWQGSQRVAERISIVKNACTRNPCMKPRHPLQNMNPYVMSDQ